MKFILAVVAVWAVASPAFAQPVPEIDGSLALQFSALAAGVAVLLKKKKR